MFKLHRVVAVVSSVVALAAVAGCSTEEDASAEAADQAVKASEAPVARFAPYLKSLKSTLESGQPLEQIAQSLLNSGRPAAFSLQGLFRVYEKMDDQFGDFRDDYKALEDGIGAYDKWSTIYQAAVSANKDQATLDKLKKQRDDALVTFKAMLTSKQFLTENGAPTKIKQTEDFLNAYKWKPRAEDRGYVLDHLIKEVKDMKTTKYDMTILEYGDGIHELRRDIRWVLIEQLGLNGMILGKDAKEACPVPAYTGLENDGRYTSYRASPQEPNACQVSLCLVGAMSKAVSDLGNLKDQAEEEVNINGEADVVPANLQGPANDIYSAIQTNDLFGQYLTQLNACKAALK